MKLTVALKTKFLKLTVMQGPLLLQVRQQELDLAMHIIVFWKGKWPTILVKVENIAEAIVFMLPKLHHLL